jgi:phage-related protein
MTWLLSDLTPTLDASTPNASLDGSSSGTSQVNSFIWIPSYGSDNDSEQMIREARFGDGYRLRAGIGINSIDDKWNLVFSIRSSAEKDAIRDFLRARTGGRSFFWTPFDELTPIKVFCKKWKIVADDYNSFNITCTFERVYGE